MKHEAVWRSRICGVWPDQYTTYTLKNIPRITKEFNEAGNVK